MTTDLDAEQRRHLSKIATPAHVAQYCTRDLQPDARWRPTKHLLYITERVVEACTDSYQRFIQVAVAVRHGKSELLSVWLIFWYLGMFPDRQVWLISYTDEKASQWGARVRDLVIEYGEELFGIQVDGGTSASKLEWTIKGRRGGMKSGGIAGAWIGGGPDLCVASGTLVDTPQGKVEIDTLAHRGGTVWAYDHSTGRIVEQRITGATQSISADLVEVQFSSGRVLRCTPDHPIYIEGRGYTEAGSVNVGDEIPAVRGGRVRDLRQEAVAPRPRRGEGEASRVQGELLLQQVLERPEEDRGSVRTMRRTLREEGAPILSTMPEGASSRDPHHSHGQGVPPVRGLVPPPDQHAAVLLTDLREPLTLDSDGRASESPLLDGHQLRGLVQEDAPPHHREGRWLCRVWDHRESRGASRQREARGQRSDESGDPLQEASHRAPQVERDAVAVVRHLRRGSYAVYDIEVEGSHNFFAGEVLVHNCVIDDPIKNQEEAGSASARRKMREWYDGTLRSRLSPVCTVILTMARWHEDDLAGSILSDAATEPADRSSEADAAVNDDGIEVDYWEVINMPALAAPTKTDREAEGFDFDTWEDELGRKFGDPLWPDKWPKRMLIRIRNTIQKKNPQYWDAQYQQDPTPLEGKMFKKDNWRWVPTVQRADLRLVRYWDLASTENAGDWSVGMLVGMGPDDVTYLLDIVRFREEAAGVEAQVKATAVIDGRAVPIRLEQERAGAGKAQSSTYVRLLTGWDVAGIRPQGKKEERAKGLAAQHQNKRVVIVGDPSDPRWKIVVEEGRVFPDGRHDDCVDAMVGGFEFLVEAGPTTLVAEELLDVPLERMMMAGRSMS